MTGKTDCTTVHPEAVNLRAVALFLRVEGVLVAEECGMRGERGPSCVGSLVALLEGATRGAAVLVTDQPAAALRGRISPLPQCVLSAGGAEASLTAGRAMPKPVSGTRARSGRTGGIQTDAALSHGLVRDLHSLCCALSDEIAAAGAALRGARSAEAIGTLMHHPLLASRSPVLIGASARDAAALDRVQRMGGLGIAVGPGLSRPPCGLGDTSEVHALLSRWLETVMGPA